MLDYRLTERKTVPQPVLGEPGLVQVDATEGTIQPMRVARECVRSATLR